MISADGKANKKTRNQRSSDCVLQIFIESTFKTYVKVACIFHLILIGILSILILSIKNRGGGCGDSLNGQNPLSMRKVICQQSLRAREILRFSVTFFNCQNSERENKERKVKT